MLLLALLCLLALEVTAVGMHFIATQEFHAARASARDVALRLAARSALARAVTAWPGGTLDSLAVNQSAEIPAAAVQRSAGIVASARIERVGPHLFLIRGTATSPRRELAIVGMIVATAQPSDLASNITAALRTDGVVRLRGGARIARAADTCTTAAANNAIAATSDASIVAGPGVVDGPVSIVPADSIAADRIATLSRHRIAAIALRATPQTGPVRYARDTTLVGATASGILVVDGNFTMRGGTFSGIIMVSGGVTLTDGARIDGALLVERGPTDLLDAVIALDRCAILHVFSNPSLLGPFLPRGRLWIPLF